MLKNSNLFAQSPLNPAVGKPFIILSSVESTNNYAMAKLHAGMVPAGTCIMASEQTAGKGQRGKSWSTAAGENITLSAILQPVNPRQQPFMLSAAIALASRDLLAKHITGDPSDLKIKWPNDLYWRDRKAGGILIENIYHGHKWSWAIAGIGLNINQTIFPEHLPNPVSLKLMGNSKKTYSVVRLAKELATFIDHRIRWIADSSPEVIVQDYQRHLYKAGQSVKLRKENVSFTTMIKGVSPEGELIAGEAGEHRFQFGEVEWLQESL